VQARPCRLPAHRHPFGIYLSILFISIYLSIYLKLSIYLHIILKTCLLVILVVAVQARPCRLLARRHPSGIRGGRRLDRRKTDHPTSGNQSCNSPALFTTRKRNILLRGNLINIDAYMYIYIYIYIHLHIYIHENINRQETDDLARWS